MPNKRDPNKSFIGVYVDKRVKALAQRILTEQGSTLTEFFYLKIVNAVRTQDSMASIYLKVLLTISRRSIIRTGFPILDEIPKLSPAKTIFLSKPQHFCSKKETFDIGKFILKKVVDGRQEWEFKASKIFENFRKEKNAETYPSVPFFYNNTICDIRDKIQRHTGLRIYAFAKGTPKEDDFMAIIKEVAQ